MQRFILAALVAAFCFGCDAVLPTGPESSDGCPGEEDFCAGKRIVPLNTSEVDEWQRLANEFVESHYGDGKRAYPEVIWRPCFFMVSGHCAAGWCESADRIHVSTAEPQRTGPLVAHETIHAIYRVRFGDPDARHTRPYGW